jgi:GNAT superfamily N-acetyltransferase
MSSLELVPFSEVDPVDTSAKIYGLLQDESTASQLAQFLPTFMSIYGASPEQALDRFSDMADRSREHPGFLPMLQMLDGEIIGTATIDDRLRVYRHRSPSTDIGELALAGPSTSSWIAAPYQGRGLGRESLERRIHMATIEQSHPGIWLKVANENIRSQQNVLARGFQRTYEAPLWVANTLHTHSAIYQYLAEAAAAD